MKGCCGILFLCPMFNMIPRSFNIKGCCGKFATTPNFNTFLLAFSDIFISVCAFILLAKLRHNVYQALT